MKSFVIKLAYNWIGGVAGIIKALLDWFNNEVLAKITDKEEAAAYCADVQEFATFLDGVFNRHQKWMSEGKRSALVATINAIKELAGALTDANISSNELDIIIDKIKDAIDAWKAAK